MNIKNPNAKASPKQLWRLHKLTGEDTRKWTLTMGEASAKIGELEKGKQSKPAGIELLQSATLECWKIEEESNEQS